jgi:hypothetical protein
MLTFDLECFHNPYLAEGAARMDAILTVTASAPSAGFAPSQAGYPPGPGGGPPSISEVIVLDTSGSMDGSKIRQARAAAAVAIDGLRDGTRFAVTGGSDVARMIYPSHRGLEIATARTRAEARHAIRRLRARGGTAIGTWLDLATDLLRQADGIRHATLLTDGQDTMPPDHLADAVERARGVFQCDCRGVGADWSVGQLTGIADALLGTADIVAEPEGLAHSFQEITERLMGQLEAAVTLRVRAPTTVEILLVSQVSPAVLELVAAATPGRPGSHDYATGAWGVEARDYHLRLAMPPGQAGEEIRAASVTLVVGGVEVSTTQLRGVWTDDLELSTRVSPQVRGYVAQSEMAVAIQEGMAARRLGDVATAEERLGVATALASVNGNAQTLELLGKVVVVEEAATGRVRLRLGVAAVDEMTLETRSTKTTRVRRPEEGGLA